VRREALVEKPEGKRLLGRSKSRREDNIKMDLQEVGCGLWSGSRWLRVGALLKAVMNLRVP
jgi:hypothetical protein